MTTRYLRQKYANAESCSGVKSGLPSIFEASPPVPTNSEQALRLPTTRTIDPAEYQAVASLFLLAETPIHAEKTLVTGDTTDVVPKNSVDSNKSTDDTKSASLSIEHSSSTTVCTVHVENVTNIDSKHFQSPNTADVTYSPTKQITEELQMTPVNNHSISPQENIVPKSKSEKKNNYKQSKASKAIGISKSPVLPTRKQRGVIGRPPVAVTKRKVATIKGEEIVLGPIQNTNKVVYEKDAQDLTTDKTGDDKKLTSSPKRSNKRRTSRTMEYKTPKRTSKLPYVSPVSDCADESSSSSEYNSSSEFEPSDEDNEEKTEKSNRERRTGRSKDLSEERDSTSSRKRSQVSSSRTPNQTQFERTKITCVQCKCEVLERSNSRTSRVMLLLIHAKAHTGTKQFKCPKCDYTSDHQIQRHMRKVHSGGEVINQLDDNLRRQWLQNAIKCFPSRAELFQSWYEKSSK